MPQEFSFDIVSKTDMQEVANAIQQAQKELAQRFDFKGSKSAIELQKVDPVVLDRARDSLQIADEDWLAEGPPEQRELLAIQLLASDLGGALPALRDLTHSLGEEDRHRLVRLVAPVWVNLEGARALLATAAEPVERRVVAVTTSALRLGRNYVERAGCSSPWYIPITVSNVVGEDAVGEL